MAAKKEIIFIPDEEGQVEGLYYHGEATMEELNEGIIGVVKVPGRRHFEKDPETGSTLVEMTPAIATTPPARRRSFRLAVKRDGGRHAVIPTPEPELPRPAKRGRHARIPTEEEVEAIFEELMMWDDHANWKTEGFDTPPPSPPPTNVGGNLNSTVM